MAWCIGVPKEVWVKEGVSVNVAEIVLSRLCCYWVLGDLCRNSRWRVVLSCRKGGPSLSVLRHWLKKRSLIAFQNDIWSVDLVHPRQGLGRGGFGLMVGFDSVG